LVTIADLKNKTDEYIDTKSITDSIRVQLLKSGTMGFATDMGDMKGQTDELTSQNSRGLFQEKSATKIGKMEGRSFVSKGIFPPLLNKIKKSKMSITNLP
jgi:PBP1b-binding outer membrane lipoprotein LpoB